MMQPPGAAVLKQTLQSQQSEAEDTQHLQDHTYNYLRATAAAQPLFALGGLFNNVCKVNNNKLSNNMQIYEMKEVYIVCNAKACKG